MLTRRALLSLPFCLVGAGTAYGFGIEPMLGLRLTRYRIAPPRWPAGLSLSVAVIADLHACEPWMSQRRIEGIVAATNALGADLIVLLGDYVAGHRKVTGLVPDTVWAGALGGLKAPLGVYAILGNHDWWADAAVQAARQGPPAAQVALEEAGIVVLENDSVRLRKDAYSLWLAGLGDQEAFLDGMVGGRRRTLGIDNLPQTLANLGDEDPIILLVHEPDVFPGVPAHVSLTLAGHTHGGQVNLFGYIPVIPSRYGKRYVHGHIVEEGRHLVVSAGLGCSWWPVRVGVPPEIVLIDLVSAQAIA